MTGERRAVVVICDSLRRDLVSRADAPFLAALAERAADFRAHRSVFPSTTRTSAASIATGCRPARHGLLGNTMAIDEGEGLICLSVGKPDFRDRLHAATGRTLHAPTLAERVARHGGAAVAISNVSPGAAYFLDPDGHGWVYNAAGSFGPGRRPLAPGDHVEVKKGVAGDRALTERFCDDVLRQRAPAIATLWLSEPDYTGHANPLGSPAHRRAIAGADACVRQVAETVAALDPGGERTLLLIGSDHGMETVDRTIDLEALLIAAGLKRTPDSGDVVVAPQGTSALLYFAEPTGALVGRVARFLESQDWVAESFVGGALANVGLPTDGKLRIAITLSCDDRINAHGVAGFAAVVHDPQEPKAYQSQHGGLAPNEQRPFLFASGGGFAPGPRHAPSSLIDIAPTVLRHLGLPLDGMDGTPLPLA
jgi:predicted AlkP superfamily pyrophosphatase or phosphodiesterase